MLLRRLSTLVFVMVLGFASPGWTPSASADVGDGASGAGTANQIGFCVTAAFDFDASDAESSGGNAAVGTFHVHCESPDYEYRGTVDCLHVYASSSNKGYLR